MDNGTIFGLNASFEKIKTMSKLFPSPSKKMNMNNNMDSSQDILFDYSDKMGKMNKMILLTAASGDAKGSFIDVYA